MTIAGVIGLGDMGSGIAKNLMGSGFETWGFDIDKKRLDAFEKAGGKPAADPAGVGGNADVAFVMVMTGAQAKDVLFGDAGMVARMKQGSTVVLTATIKPGEAREIGAMIEGTGVNLVDSPVSGGFPGAQGGTLTMMAAGRPDVLKAASGPMEAVSATIHHVGEEAGMGQTVKACLQSLIGSIFSATFEASVLAAKAGVSGEVLHKVVTTSSAGCGCSSTALENIIDRKFEKTGSHIATMHKDLTISLALAEELGVPMHTASTAMQLFHAGKTKYPNGDNWVVTRVIEEIAGAELHR